MRPWLRALKKHFGITAEHVAVHTEMPWYWRVIQIVLMLAIGYGIAYWQLLNQRTVPLLLKQEDVQALQTKVVRLESQLQVATAAQSNLAKEMAVMQDENMRLKEDAEFYKSILTEGGTAGVPKIHSIKVSKGGRPGEYQYQILLVQSGRHDKMVQGSVQLILNGAQDGKSMAQHVEPAGQRDGIKVNFKYYQRIEGTFGLPPQMVAQNLQVQYLAMGVLQPTLTQTASLPN